MAMMANSALNRILVQGKAIPSPVRDSFVTICSNDVKYMK